MRPGPRIPWRKSLLVRLLLTSVAIAALSVGATAWLAVETTTRAIQEERGQVLSDDTDILRQLSGFAATHADWNGVQTSIRTLSRTTGRRITLTTETGHTIADSAAPGTALPARASATVDPLTTDTYTEPGAQLAGIDPRAVGPYRLPAAERAQLKKIAEKRLACIRRDGLNASLRQIPNGHTTVIIEGGDGSVPVECLDSSDYGYPTSTEQKALGELDALAKPCSDLNQNATAHLRLSIQFIPGLDTPTGGALHGFGGSRRRPRRRRVVDGVPAGGDGDQGDADTRGLHRLPAGRATCPPAARRPHRRSRRRPRGGHPLLTIPNQLGVDYNARLLQTIADHVAPHLR